MQVIVVRVTMVPVRPVRVRVVGFYPDHIKRTETHATFGADAVGERAHATDRPLEDRRLKAILVVQMHVRRRHHEIMMVVPDRGQPGGQIADLMIVDIGERRDARGVWIGCQVTRIDHLANKISHGFGSALVAALLRERIKGGRQIGVERDGYARRRGPKEAKQTSLRVQPFRSRLVSV